MPPQQLQSNSLRSRRPQFCAGRGGVVFVFAVLCALAVFSLTSPVRAQDAWHMTAYRNYAAFMFDASPATTDYVQQTLMRDVGESCDNVLGANWDLELAVVDNRWRIAAAQESRAADRDELIKLVLELQSQRSAEGIVDPIDKVFLIRVSHPAKGWQVIVQELDVATRVLGHAEIVDVPQGQVLSETVFQAMLDVFSPLARIEESDDTDDVRIGLRAGSLPRRDPNLKLAEMGDLFMPIIRQNNRDGSPRGIRPVPWTYLRIEPPPVPEVEEGETPPPVSPSEILEDSPIVSTAVYTALQSAFSKRRRGREEKYALRVHIPNESTTFRAVDRFNADRPLEGYEVISYTPDSPKTRRLGTTSVLGELTIPVNESPLHLLLVRSGSRMLARLPIVPGAQEFAQIELADDRERLEMEGYITGLQEEMVGVFTQRELMMKLISSKLDADEVAEAQQYMQKLRELPSAQSFRQRIQSRRSRYFTTDQYAEIHVSKLFDDTERVLDRFFKSDVIADLQRRIDEATAN